MSHNVLYSEEAIAARVGELAKKIARAPLLPDIAMPVLVGGFIFAADLVRALAKEGVELEIEMLWLRSYGDKRVASAISMIAGPSEQITGRIVNKGSRELPVPQDIRVTLSDASNHELYHWNFAPGIQTLKAGQSSVFRTRLSNPPATARHLEVRFAKDDK